MVVLLLLLICICIHTCVKCIRDFGPAHVFWLFSFERYNGILEFIPSNNRSVEVQIARRFVESTCDLSEEYREEFTPIFKEPKVVGSLAQLPNLVGSTPDHLFSVDCHELPKYFPRITTTYSFLLFQPARFKRHQQHHFYGKPVTLWEPDCYKSNTITFLPVQYIISRTASLVDKCTLSNSSHENVLLVCRIVE